MKYNTPAVQAGQGKEIYSICLTNKLVKSTKLTLLLYYTVSLWFEMNVKKVQKFQLFTLFDEGNGKYSILDPVKIKFGWP